PRLPGKVGDPRVPDRTPPPGRHVEALASTGRLASPAPDARIPPELPLRSPRPVNAAPRRSVHGARAGTRPDLRPPVLHPHTDRRITACGRGHPADRLRALRTGLRRLPPRPARPLAGGRAGTRQA